MKLLLYLAGTLLLIWLLYLAAADTSPLRTGEWHWPPPIERWIGQ